MWLWFDRVVNHNSLRIENFHFVAIEKTSIYQPIRPKFICLLVLVSQSHAFTCFFLCYVSFRGWTWTTFLERKNSFFFLRFCNTLENVMTTSKIVVHSTYRTHTRPLLLSGVDLLEGGVMGWFFLRHVSVWLIPSH